MGTNMKAWTFMILRNQFYLGEAPVLAAKAQLDPKEGRRSETLVAVRRDPGGPGWRWTAFRQGLAMLPRRTA